MTSSASQPTAPHFKQPLLKTPFHERARALSQVDSFVAWAGYTTVDVFSTVEQEYFAIRNATTLYDLTPMVKYRIAGRDAVLLPPSRAGSAHVVQLGPIGIEHSRHVADERRKETLPHLLRAGGDERHFGEDRWACGRVLGCHRRLFGPRGIRSSLRPSMPEVRPG